MIKTRQNANTPDAQLLTKSADHRRAASPLPTLPVLAILLLLPSLLPALGTADTPRAPESGSSVETFAAYLDSRIPAMLEEYTIAGLSLALVREGELVYSAAYGWADRDARRPMAVDTPCRVESISKSLTAWGVMKLHQEGRIDLDAPLTEYLNSWSFPPSPYPVETITIRQLLSHSSGLPLGTIGVRYAPDEPKPTLREYLTGDALPAQNPGSSFYYSNVGFNLLELLIEEVSGRDFGEYMQNEVLLPLGMEAADFSFQDDVKRLLPKGYGRGEVPIPPYVYPDKAAGGLIAPVEDIASFVIASMPAFSRTGAAVLTPDSIDMIHSSQVPLSGYYSLVFDGYGFGHFVEFLSGGIKALSHGGQGSGWMTHFHLVPETGDGIVMLTNSQNSWPFFALMLRDWARWCGFSSPGMGLIVPASRILMAFVIVGSLLLLGRFLLLGRAIARNKRHLAPFSSRHRLIRSIEALLALALLGLLAWAVNLEYLFLTSVFPKSAGPLGFLILFFAAMLLLSALFPKSPAGD